MEENYPRKGYLTFTEQRCPFPCTPFPLSFWQYILGLPLIIVDSLCSIIHRIQNIMGMLMSLLGGKGSSQSQMLSLAIGVLYNQFLDKDIKEFDDFHVVILDIFNTINMSLPGKHYDTPPHKEIEDLFKNWKASNAENRKEVFTSFMKSSVNLSKVDDSMMITGIVAPPAAMIVKKTGQTVPQLKAIRAIPDVVFVPSATILALTAVKVSRILFMRKMAS